MATNDAVFQAWHDYATGKRKHDSLRGSNVSYRGDSVFSYAWEMGRIIRDKNDKPRLLWLNGDIVTSTTSVHQWQLRGVLKDSELPVVILPGSALESAGIIVESIKPIEIKPDGWETIRHHSESLPKDAELITTWSDPKIEQVVYENDPGEYPVKARERLGGVIDGRWVSKKFWVRHRKTEPQSMDVRLGIPVENPWDYESACVEPLLGEWFTDYPHSKRVGFIPVREDEFGFSWETKVHRLGECVFRAKVRDRKPIPNSECSACEGKKVVKVRIWSGLVDRACRDCSGTGRRLKSYERWATFISAFDPQEPGRFYFLCELPYGAKPKNLDEALECLKPEAVKMAEMNNRRVVRQGDIFFIETDITDKYVKENAKQVGKTRELMLLGQNHSATRVAYMNDGLQLAKGRVYHLAGEHRAQELGERDSWWVVARNTVPIRRSW